MKKIIVEFHIKDPYDLEEYNNFMRGQQLRDVIDDITNEIWRPARKHGYSDPAIQKLLDYAHEKDYTIEHPEYGKVSILEELISLLEDKYNEILEENLNEY